MRGMGNIVVVVALCALLIGVVGCTTTAGGEGRIEWLSSWGDALDKAQAENKPIMVNFYTDVCPACKKLDETTLSDKDLSNFLNENFACLKSNAGKSSLHQFYTIRAVPTTVFTKPDGSEIGRIVGAAAVADFYQNSLVVLDIWENELQN